MNDILRWAAGLACGGILTVANAFAASPVFINEVLASNKSYSDFLGHTVSWVELYNPSASDINLANMSLSQDPNIPRQWIFPEGATIRAGDFYVVYCDNNTAASVYNTGFGLNNNGDAIYLYDGGGVRLDSVVFGMQIDDYSIGRQQTAAGSWTLMRPTLDSANTPATLGNSRLIKINEWMARPDAGKRWFELFNPEALPVEISGMYLSNSLKKNPYKYQIPALSYIGVGSGAFRKIFADSSTSEGPNYASFSIDKAGDEIGVFSSAGLAVDAVTFGAQTTDVSEGRFPDGAVKIVSYPGGGTPAASNFLPLTNVAINEILTHTDPPLQDALELYNPTAADVNVGGWYISDSPDNFKKYQIPAGTLLKANSYLVFTEQQFTNTPSPFNFNSSEGDSAIVSASDTLGALTGYRALVKFGASANAVSFGRYTNSVGGIYYPAQAAITLGAANSGPLVGPIVINEIMHYPPPAAGSTNDNTLDEYVELFNLSNRTIPLHHPINITNTWRLTGGIDYVFSASTVISPGGYLVVVSFDPMANPAALIAFRAKFGLSSSDIVLGPFSKKLGNSGDSVELQAPDEAQGIGHINEGFVPYYTVDQLDYATVYPWPTGANGSGLSLQRKDAFAFAIDPANWLAAAPSAGRRNTGAMTDRDRDGMPDDWELTYGFDINNPADAALDANGNGVSNLQEYLNGADPLAVQNALTIASIRKTSSGIALEFEAVAGQTYTLQKKDSLSDPGWVKLLDVTTVSSSGAMTISDDSQSTGSTRYYRLVSPSQP